MQGFSAGKGKIPLFSPGKQDVLQLPLHRLGQLPGLLPVLPPDVEIDFQLRLRARGPGDGPPLRKAEAEHLRAGQPRRLLPAPHIQDAGGEIICDTCPVLCCTLTQRGYKTVATNSGKMAHYAPGLWNLQPVLLNTDECIRAAIDGKWGGTV